MTRTQSATKAVDAGTRGPDYILPPRAPNVLAYGVGVDSTALLVELEARGEKPDLVITADTGVEKPATYEYLDVIRVWMAARGIPFEIVRYQPRRFKHWPPYYSLLENGAHQRDPAKQIARRLKLQPQIQEGATGRLPENVAARDRRMGEGQEGDTPDRL